MNILELHRKVKDNIGDAFCNPSRYFEFDEISSTEVLNSNLDVRNKNLIIGGGGLIHKGFQKYLKSFLDQPPNRSAIWGIGHNFGPKHVAKSHGDVYYPSWIYNADLIGIRDWIEGYEQYYLPCVSCMHSAFDKTYETKYPVSFFIHSFKTGFRPTPADRVLENKHLDFDNAIKFLGESEIVVTDSYHGAYWAQLLGKSVITGSWSVKFNHFKYPATKIIRLNDWNIIDPSPPPPIEFLDECRDLNRKFYQQVLKLFY